MEVYRTPEKVDFVVSERDRMILRLGAMGRPAAYIAMVCRCSVSQVRYRLNHRAGMKLNQIRQGTDKYQFLKTLETDPAVQHKLQDRIDYALRSERIIDHRGMITQRPAKKGGRKS